MKAFTIVSLIINLVLLTLLAAQPKQVKGVLGSLLTKTSKPHNGTSTPRPEPAVKPVAPPPLWTQLGSADLRTLISRLRAAGFPPDAIRAIVTAQVDEIYNPKIRALREPDRNAPFWSLPSTYYTNNDPRFLALTQISQERQKLLHSLLAGVVDPADQEIQSRREFGTLPAGKIVALQGVIDDYQEMSSALKAATGGIMLQEDNAKLALLEQEKRADLSAILSPAELEEYEMRASPITRFLHSSMTLMDASAQEFQAIYNANKSAAAAFAASGGNFNDYQQNQVLEAGLITTLKSALSEDRFMAYVRAADYQTQPFLEAAARNSLAPATVDQAFALRQQATSESVRIADDSALGPDEKRAALQNLAAASQTQLSGLLGPKLAAQFYTTGGDWMTSIANGSAVTLKTVLPIVNDVNGLLHIFSYSGMITRPVSSRPTKGQQ